MEEKYALINKEKNELHDKHIEVREGEREGEGEREREGWGESVREGWRERDIGARIYFFPPVDQGTDGDYEVECCC